MIFKSIAGALAITVKNYTGIWIPQRDFYPFAVVACEHLSDNTKFSVYSTIQCGFIDPWKESRYRFIVHDDWITNKVNSRLIGKYNVDGEIELFGRSTNGYERLEKWQRPNVRDYIGIWEQGSERSKEFSNVYCNHLSEEQLECILPNFEEEKRFDYTVRETSITNNANSSLQGTFNRDGSISWFLDTSYVFAWKRKGKFLKYLWNRAMKCSKHSLFHLI